MMRRRGHRLVAALLVLLPAGCGDALDRPGTWRATGVNVTNLAIAAIDKRDLATGQPESGADGQIAAQAVERLRQDKVKPLGAVATTLMGAPGASN